MIPATLEPYALAIAAAGGLLVGAAGMGWFQQTRIDALKVEAREAAVSSEERRQTAQRAADAASATVAGLSTDLAAAHRLQRVVEIEVEKEIVRVASPERVCLGPAVVSVLQRATVRRAPEGPGAGEPAGTGLRLAPDPDGSASEAAVARWMSAAHGQYRGLQDQHRALAGVVRALPCVQVVAD